MPTSRPFLSPVERGDEWARKAFADHVAGLTPEELPPLLDALQDELRGLDRQMLERERQRMPGSCGSPYDDVLGDRERCRYQLSIVRQAIATAAAPEEDTEEWSDQTRSLRDRANLRFLDFKAFDETLLPHGIHEGVLWTITADTEQGKSTFVLNIAIEAGRQGWHVAVVPSDSGREPTLIRLAERLGLDARKVEAGDTQECDALDAALEEHHITVAPGEASVEAVFEIEKSKAKAAGRPFLLIIDSFHEAVFRAAATIETGYLAFEAGVRASKAITRTPAIVLATVEANRLSSYRGQSADVNAGAGSRKLSFAPTLAMGLKLEQKFDRETGQPEVVRVTVTKNKVSGLKGAFFLQLDRARAAYSPTEKPGRQKADSEAKATKAAAKARAKIVPALRKLWREDEGRPASMTAIAKAAGLNKSRADFRNGLALLIDARELEATDTGAYKPGPTWGA